MISISDKGLFEFKNQQELANAARFAMTIASTPDHLKKNGLEAVMAAMIFVKQRGLPQSAMNQCAFIKGKLSQFGSLVTALAERHHEYGERKDFFVDENCEEICVRNKNLKAKVFAAVVQVKKKGATVWSEYFFSTDDALVAGLMNDKTSKDSSWGKYLRDMLFHKANSRAMRANYASALEGVNYHEDMMEVWETKDVTTSGVGLLDKAAILNDNFGQSQVMPISDDSPETITQ